MSCVIAKACKDADDIKQCGFDLSWYAGRKWRPGVYVAAGTAIRVQPQSLGGEQPTTGWQYRANANGWTGDSEPEWPEDSAPIVDGSTSWTREAVGSDSLWKTIFSGSDVAWDAEAPMTVGSPVLVTTAGQLIIAAHHSGGIAKRKLRSWADVTFSDGTKQRFEIQWKIT